MTLFDGEAKQGGSIFRLVIRIVVRNGEEAFPTALLQWIECVDSILGLNLFHLNGDADPTLNSGNPGAVVMYRRRRTDCCRGSAAPIGPLPAEFKVQHLEPLAGLHLWAKVVASGVIMRSLWLPVVNATSHAIIVVLVYTVPSQYLVWTDYSTWPFRTIFMITLDRGNLMWFSQVLIRVFCTLVDYPRRSIKIASLLKLYHLAQLNVELEAERGLESNACTACQDYITRIRTLKGIDKNWWFKEGMEYYTVLARERRARGTVLTVIAQGIMSIDVPRNQDAGEMLSCQAQRGCIVHPNHVDARSTELRDGPCGEEGWELALVPGTEKNLEFRVLVEVKGQIEIHNIQRFAERDSSEVTTPKNQCLRTFQKAGYLVSTLEGMTRKSH
ncbi:hypothetical protein L210DRAFT_3503418 [Boletus edulis BED1]|uniref:Uncharacterized protein n=1 Tax=Boletus edulis BED1 TaxID=1328754 RepID=A0AAD4GF12_BOLED|nr:hypothetical protein L210DRAFT_3503418 [Boletus edulis BED1]